MKNNLKLTIFYLFISLIVSSNISSSQVVNFDVSEIEITENGDIMRGYNGGEVTTNNGVKIKAQTFEYTKSKSLLQAIGGVNFTDENKNINIRADKVLYFMKAHQGEDLEMCEFPFCNIEIVGILVAINFFDHNSVPSSQISTTFAGNSSYQPPGPF